MPFVARADRIHGVPKFRGYSRIGGILEHASKLAILDLPSNLAPELKVVALIVDRPGAVRLHIHSVVGVGNELVKGKGPLARKNADISHADERNAVPSFCAHGGVRAPFANSMRGFARRKISGELAVTDDGSALCGHAFIVVRKGAQTWSMLLGSIGYYVDDGTAVAQVAQLVDSKK